MGDDNMGPINPRERKPDPAAVLYDGCQTCGRPWKDCACGETQGDVLDLEHALSQGAAMEARGVVR